MIYFFTHRYHPYTIRSFVDGWGRSIRPRIVLRDYDELRFARRLPAGAYIFADSDRLDPVHRAFVSEIGEQIAGRGWPLLNRPSQVVYRVELANLLRQRGLSRVGAYRVDSIPDDLRWPVFVRIEDDHSGRIGAPAHDRDALEQSIKSFSDVPREKLFAVEFCETRCADGLYRKYGVQRIEDSLIARHIFFSREWIVKYSDLLDPHLLEEEKQFIEAMPEDITAQVRAVFEAAGTNYGRLDFSMIDGRIQPWEINLNPMLARSVDKMQFARLGGQGFSTSKVRDAFGALADRGAAIAKEEPLVLNLSGEQRARVGVRPADNALQLLGLALGRIERLPIARNIVSTCRRARWLAMR